MTTRVARRVVGPLSICGVMLAACAPNLGPKPTPMPAADLAATRTFTAPATEPASEWPAADWWKSYNDPQLDALIGEAIAGAPDLKIAEARMRQALAVVTEVGGDLWPTIAADGDISTVRQSLNQGFPPQFQSFLPRGWHTGARVQGDLNYELDLFGRNRANFASAKADARAAQIEVKAAELALSTSVASAYADLVRLTADRSAVVDAARVRRDTFDLVNARAKQNLENQGQVSQAEAGVATSQAELESIDRQIAVTRHQIAALLGKGPDRGLDIVAPTGVQIAGGLPASTAVDLVGRRPDIVAARLRAEAAAKRIDAAHADFYPNIDISALIGFQALDMRDVFKHTSLMGQAGPAVHLPLFDGGKISGRYRGARAEYDEAVAMYDRTVVNAFREVADAITNQRSVNAELVHIRAALTASENSYRIAGIRYRGGLSRYIDVLTAEDKMLSLRRDVADLEALSFSQNVALVRALGGGFTLNNPA